MPFPAQRPRPFTREQIELVPPGRYGVYGLLSETGEYIYIGGGDIRTHLQTHLDGALPCVAEHAPTRWVEWVTPTPATTVVGVILPDIEGRQRELIEEYSPACNGQVE